MSTDIITSPRRRGAWTDRLRRAGVRWGGCAAAASLLAACGGAPQLGVAHLGAAASPSATAAADLSKSQDALAFSRCMRQHGITNFPDPGSGGGLRIDSSSGIDPESPRFQAAQQACRSLLPRGAEPNPAQQAAMQQAALRFSQCMRQHGIADFPDPEFGPGTMKLQLPHSVDPQAPQFQAAQQACQSLMPKPGGGGSGPSTSTGGGASGGGSDGGKGGYSVAGGGS